MKASYERNSSRGFTLVELIVTIGVLLVLAGLIAPVAARYVSSTQKETCRVNMQGVMLAYQARTDSLYGDINTQAALTSALSFSQYNVRSATAYDSPCGGTCTITFSNDNRSITNIVCSKHGSLMSTSNGINNTTLKSDKLLSNSLATVVAQSQGTKNPLRVNTSVDSSAVNGPITTAMMNYFVSHGVDFASLNVNSWAIRYEGGHQVIWLTDQYVSDLNPGDMVRVIRCNSNGNTYTAGYMQVSETTENNATYNVFTGGTAPGVWVEYGKADKLQLNTKTDYDKTVELFNSMPIFPE